MKNIILSLCVVTFYCLGCNSVSDTKKEELKPIEKVVINSFTIHKDSLVLNGNQGNWYYKNKLFSGYAVKYYPNNSLKEKIGFFNGKKQNEYRQWFANGVLKLESHYNQNVLVGSYKTWWNNDVLASEVNYLKGKKQGVELKWFKDGTLSRKRNLVDGREEGLQKAWLENGKLYVNYEAKNGRVFGMKRANSCYQLKNEKIEESKKI
ncbi:hypothetical protein BW723_11290 [Polaribacter reichenbachii]|uniref:Membrane-binding protein n=1 Tax=Polaribacter reichenbachii TaxID=996801 RepID=A0A1B8TPS1_9FLAO|nr:hypothetical protein [Polaribacter reichenbachii]APZ46831.1 hypothetical protein BW723_11290 [Polaribacter reichenbachii]AUC17474.1 hypothetical protein BTO17_01735 [Polaribacter reichenbachii]OBY61650.1 hypothetical protein LPB301_16475 [Polaribacter reichenbachii]